MKPLILVLCMMALVGCGSTPAAPTPVTPQPINIAGNWTGTFTFTPFNGGQRTILAIVATFTQAQGNITGQATLPDGSKLLVSGVVTATTLTSTMQFTAPAPSPCSGTASVSGSVASSLIRFTIPGIATSGSCTFFTNGDFVLNR